MISKDLTLLVPCPVLDQFGQHVKLTRAVGESEILSFLVSHNLGLEFQCKHAPL